MGNKTGFCRASHKWWRFWTTGITVRKLVERNLPATDTSPIVMPTEDSNSRSPVVGEQQASELVQVPQLCHNTQRELVSRQIVILNWTF